jgi:hypothetical protein
MPRESKKIAGNNLSVLVAIPGRGLHLGGTPYKSNNPLPCVGSGKMFILLKSILRSVFQMRADHPCRY